MLERHLWMRTRCRRFIRRMMSVKSHVCIVVFALVNILGTGAIVFSPTAIGGRAFVDAPDARRLRDGARADAARPVKGASRRRRAGASPASAEAADVCGPSN